MSAFVPAQRAGVGLLIGVAGASGSGKTFSALRVARGLAGGDDAKIAFIDTEAGRALHYAPSPGEAPGPASFAFSHAALSPPFTPERYGALIAEADQAGFAVIVIDSFSHVWAGEGGLQDWHDAEVEAAVERAKARWEKGDRRWPFDAEREADKASVGAWRAPKTAHKRLVARLLQCRAHLVICLRAEDKLRMETTDEQGRNGKTYTKTTITPAEKLPPTERWQPVCEKRLPYELITSLVLSPDAPGVPIPLKLQEQHRPFVPLDRPLDEAVGERLAAWARGAAETGQQRAAPRPAVTSQRRDVGPPNVAFARQNEDAPAARGAARAGAGEAEAGAGVSEAPAPSLRVSTWDGHRLDPAEPQAIVVFPGADETEWRAFGKALREAVAAAPTRALAETWVELNDAPLRARSPKLADWVAGALPLATAL